MGKWTYGHLYMWQMKVVIMLSFVLGAVDIRNQNIATKYNYSSFYSLVWQ